LTLVLAHIKRLLKTKARHRKRTHFDIHVTYTTEGDGRDAIELLSRHLGSPSVVVERAHQTTLSRVRATERSIQKALALVDPHRVHVSYERSPKANNPQSASRAQRLQYTD